MKKLVLLVGILSLCTVLAFGANAAKPKIGMAKARAIALKRSPGTIKSGELETEHRQLVYSFDIKKKNGSISEVQVNAYSGKIVSVTKESAKKEAAEEKEEGKGKH